MKKIIPRNGMKWTSVLLAFIPVLLVAQLYISQNPFLDAFEAKTYDLRFKTLRGAIPASPDIVIAAIDDKSIAELGRFPWTRTQYVRLLDKLSAAGVKVILFDAFFPEQETAAIDQSFATAISKAGNVILAATYDFDSAFNIAGTTRSLPVIERAADGVGHINMLPEDDGVIRRNRLLIDEGGRQVPSLGLVAAMAALGEKEFVPGSFEIRLGKRSIPVDAAYSMWINYAGASGNYPRYSFADIVHGRIDPALLSGKIIFVGATALGIYDMRVTPFHANTPGVEVHAAVADSIISGRFIRQTGIEAVMDIAFILVLGLLTYAISMRMRLYGAIPVTVLLVSGYVWLSYGFFQQGHWVSMVYPPLAAMAALLAGGSFRFLVLERSTRELRTLFSSYLSDKLVAQLEKDPDAVRIGGEIKDVTVLFTDIKGFTSFSEQHTPQEVVNRLNEYLGAMVRVIVKLDGTVDKFIGDGIMAYWGAPLAQPDHAKLAVACVLEMRATMHSLSDKWKAEGVEPFEIRGGAQSGEVVAGKIGLGGKKMEYTAIGDTVNQAARLEGAAKLYGVDFLVGENTWRATKEIYCYRELDTLRVAGKQTPVTIYQPMGDSPQQSPRLVELFQGALASYRTRNWSEARERFSAILLEFPGDGPSKMYVERCDYFMHSPPPADWDGVFNRRSK